MTHKFSTINRATTMVSYYLIIALLFLFPFGQVTRIPLAFSPSVRLYAQDIVIVLLVINIVIRFLRKQKQIFPPPYKWIGLFALVGLLSLIANVMRYSANELLTGSLYLIRFFAYSVVYITSYQLVVTNKRNASILIILLSLSGIVTGVLGIIQYALYPNLRNLMYLGWDPHEYRLFGTFFDSGFVGLILVLTLVLLYFLSIRNKTTIQTFVDKKILVIASVITYIAMALTYSRSSFISLFVSFSIFSWIQKSWKLFVVTSVLLALTVFLLPQPTPTAEGTNLARTTSGQARLSNMEQSLEVIRDYPILGTGFNMMRYEQRNRTIVPYYEWEESNAAAGLDNSFLFVLATTGVIGFIFYVLMWVKLLAATDNYQVLILSSCGAVFAHSMFNNSLFYPWIMIWLWILLGVAHASKRL